MTARRLAVAVSLLLTAMLVGVVPTMAAGNGTVDAQVTIARAAACLEISTSAVDFGTLSLGAENAPGSPEITVTNCGDGDESLLASGTNATGEGVTWNLVDSAATCADTLGTDNYHLGLATPAGAPIATLATANKDVGTLGLDGSVTHSARISTACPGSSGTGAVLNMQINYLATNLDTPPVVLEELTEDQVTTDAAAAFLFGGTRDVTIAGNCATNPSVGCVGGVPVSPAPQVHVVGSNVVATEVVGQGRWDVTANLALTSPVAIPVTYQGVDCNLTFDTAAGAIPHLTASVTLTYRSHPGPAGPKNYIELTNAFVTGVESADYQISGQFLCGVASIAASAIQDQLQQIISSQFGATICGAPEPAVFMACPPLN